MTATTENTSAGATAGQPRGGDAKPAPKKDLGFEVLVCGPGEKGLRPATEKEVEALIR